jgi:hypothetical protein
MKNGSDRSSCQMLLMSFLAPLFSPQKVFKTEFPFPFLLNLTDWGPGGQYESVMCNWPNV